MFVRQHQQQMFKLFQKYIALDKQKILNSEEKLELLNLFWKPDDQLLFPINKKTKRRF